MLVQVTRINIPAGSTIGFGEGTTDDGRTVRFVGDHRPMLDIGMALGHSDEPIEVELEDWQIQSVTEAA